MVFLDEIPKLPSHYCCQSSSKLYVQSDINRMLNYISYTLSIQIIHLYCHSVGFHLIECVELKKLPSLVPEKTIVISVINTELVIYLITVLMLTGKERTKPEHKRSQTKIGCGKTMLYSML